MKNYIGGILLFSISFLACGNDTKIPIADEDVFIPEVPSVIKGWEVCDDFGKLPNHLFVYKSPAQLLNKNINAYIVVADMNRGARFNVIGEKSGLFAPSAYYEKNESPSVIMNGGYFAASGSLSLICRNNEVICGNIQNVTRSNGSSNVPFYPTRSVFAYKGNGKYAAEWIYSVNETIYSYPRPATNKSGQLPLAHPSKSFPVGASAWSAQEAIGGGPVLLKGGAIMNTWEAELFDAASGIGPINNNPRSAVGITKNNHLIFFVCEGRNMTPNVLGLTLQEVAQILKDLGCVDALNLDGGGSTCMLINGKQTIQPSDGKQRAVSGCVILN